MLATLVPIGLGEPAARSVAYFWLDLQNQQRGPLAVCDPLSVVVGLREGGDDAAGGVGESAGPHGGSCVAYESLVEAGGHLAVGLQIPVSYATRPQAIESLRLTADALSLAPDGGIAPDAKLPIVIELKGAQLRRLPRFADLPVIKARRAKGGASFGGWSASVRFAGGPAHRGGPKTAYWVSLVNERTERKAICSFVAITAKLFAGDKEIRRIYEGKEDSNGCADNVRLDTGWRLAGPGRPFTFLFPVEPKPGDERADRIEFAIQAVESSSGLERPFSTFSIDASVDLAAP
jgi:hypothetical protein